MTVYSCAGIQTQARQLRDECAYQPDCSTNNACYAGMHLLQIDLLEASVIQNAIVMQTVLQEVRHRSAPVYKRLKDIIAVPTKRFYTFTNEHHRCGMDKCLVQELFD